MTADPQREPAGLFGLWVAEFRSLLTVERPERTGTLWLLLTILAATGCIRWWTIDSPAIDRTDWKEIDHIAVSVNYWQNGFDFIHPEIDWPAEPPRVTAMDFPLAPFLAAGLYKLFGFHAWTVRLVTLASWLGLSVGVYFLARREIGPLGAVAASLASAVMPLYHPFSRYLYSEPLMIACSVAALYFFAEYMDRKRCLWGLAATAAFSLAVALKLTPLYLLLPLAWLSLRRNGWRPAANRGLAAVVGAGLVLPAVWYAWCWHLTETSIDVFGIFRGHDKMQTRTMLGSWEWYQVMFDRVSWDILGGKIGFGLGIVGLLASLAVRRGAIYWADATAIGSFFVIVAEGQIDTSYRQLTLIPAASGFVALGALALAAGILSGLRWALRVKSSSRRGLFAVAVLACGLIVLIGVRRRDDIFRRDAMRPVDPRRWQLAQEIVKAARPEDRLICIGEYTIHKGGNDLSPILYYYSGMQGWTLQQGEWTESRLAELKAKGGRLLAAVETEREPEAAAFVAGLKSKYGVVFEGQGVALLDLGRETDVVAGRE